MVPYARANTIALCCLTTPQSEDENDDEETVGQRKEYGPLIVDAKAPLESVVSPRAMVLA